MDLETYIYHKQLPKTMKQNIKILIQILEGIAFLHS